MDGLKATDYPHQCLACGSAAYCGLTTVDCSNAGCVHGKKVREARPPRGESFIAPAPRRHRASSAPIFQPGEYRLEMLRGRMGLSRADRDVVEVDFRVHESVSPHPPVGGEVTWMSSNPIALASLARAIGTDILEDMAGKFVRAHAEKVRTKGGFDFIKVSFMRDVA